MRALGIDPGLGATGFAIVEALPMGTQAHEWGCIQTGTRLSNQVRLGSIYQNICQIIAQWSPDIVVVEEAFVDPKYPKAALRLGEVRGTVSVAAHNMEVEVFEIKPTEVKLALTGKGLATKEQVQEAVNRILNLSSQSISHHASDAMALALTGLSRKGALYHL